MNYKMIGRLIAPILCIEAVFMLPALGIAHLDGSNAAVRAFAMTIAASVLVAGLLWVGTSNAPRRGFYAREGFVLTGAAWIVMSVFGALPFWISGEIPHLSMRCLRRYRALPRPVQVSC